MVLRDKRSARDWTLAAHSALCRAALDSGRVIQTVEQYIRSPHDRAVVFRHDVDRFPANAVQLAELEHRLGIAATYYVRVAGRSPTPAFLGRLSSLGHEVGYHYEVLTKTRGDIEAAVRVFRSELESLRATVPIRTAACHGSPLSRWDSLALWSVTEPAEFDLVGEAYVDIDYSALAYYTDTGRDWHSTRANLRDRVDAAPASRIPARSTDDLLGILENDEIPRLCIQTHPERWSATRLQLLRSATLDLASNTIKTALQVVRPSHARY